MSATNNPRNLQRLAGSEGSPPRDSLLIGPAAPDAVVEFTVVLRRRPDGPPLPDPNYYTSAPSTRPKPLSNKRLTEFYGATKADLAAVERFLLDTDLTIVESSATRRTVIARGSVERVNAAFSIALTEYDSAAPASSEQAGRAHMRRPRARQRHRSYRGPLYLPESVAAAVVGVYGLDNRKLTQRSATPAGAGIMTVPQVCRLYGWPTTPVPGQTIGILSAGGVDLNDITLYYENLNKSLYAAGWFVPGAGGFVEPTPSGAAAGNLQPPSGSKLVFVTGAGLQANSGVSDGELNMDISLSSTVAQGATIAVYLFDGTVQGWVNALKAAIYPNGDQPVPTVLSSSYYLLAGDDSRFLDKYGITPAGFIVPIHEALEDAAMRHVTVCMASGDHGTDSLVNDGYTHVQYPPSDPHVLCCGGTSIGNIGAGNIASAGGTFEEWPWSDDSGASGGGVSGYFPLESWQGPAAVPQSLNETTPVPAARGIPDVAANSSEISGYAIYTNGYETQDGGTSAAAPVVAGLIAQANEWLGHNVGYLNPLLYATFGSACRRVPGGYPLGIGHTGPPSPADNAYGGVTGYPTTPANQGWNPSTGWGVLDWSGLQAVLTPKEKEKEKDKEFEKLHPDKLRKTEIKEPKELKDITKDFDKTRKSEGKEATHKESSKEKELETGGQQPGRGGGFGTEAVAAAGITGALERLGQEVNELRAFIRPEQRPAVGDRIMARAEDDKPAAAAAAEE